MKHKLLTSLALTAVFLSPALRAEEGGAGHYAPGATATAVDMLPGRETFAYANMFTYYRGDAGASKPFKFGGLLAANVDATLNADTSFLLYQTPWQIWGVGYGLAMAIPYAWVNVDATVQYSTPGGTVARQVSDSQSGLGDIQLIPVMLGWTNGDLKVGGNFSIYAPTGEYESGRLANTGRNYWTFEPALNFSWVSSKIGTEFTLFTGLDFNTKNHETDYQSGTSFHLDGTVAQHLPLFGGFLGVGANGFYYLQISGDSGSGATLGDFKGWTTGVGPVVNYVHKIGRHDFFIEAKWLPELAAEKRTRGDFVWLKAGFAF